MAKKRNTRRLIVSGILVGAMVALGVTASTVSASADPAPVVQSVSVSAAKSLSFSASAPDGAYRVTGLKIPAGTSAVGTVTGPSHYSKTLALTARTQTFLVRPGTYTLNAKTLVVTPTDASGATPGTYLPLKATIKFTVARHKIATVQPNYDNIISPNVSVATPESLTPFTPPANTDDPYTIGIAQTYTPGTIVASGVSADAPYGLMVKVDSVGDTSGGVTQYTVENASLEDAIPRGNYSQDVSNAVSLTSSDPGSTSPTSRLGKRLQSISDAHPDTHSDTTQSDAPPYIKAISCKGSATAGIDAELEGDLTTVFSANWNIFDSSQDSVTLTTTASLKDSIIATIDGKASCDLDKTELLAEPIELGTIEFLIGPVPVVINNTLNFTVAGSAEVDAKFEMGIKASVSTSTGATIGTSGITPEYSPPVPKVKVIPPTVSLKGDAQFYLGVRVNMLLYDVAGPFVEAELGPEISVDTTKKPWWSIDLGLKVGAGLRLDFFGLEPIEDDHIYTHDFPIADSTTFGTPTPPPPHTGDPGTPGNPWNPPPDTPPTVPTGPGIGADGSPFVDLAGTGLQNCIPESLNQQDGSAVTEDQIATLTQLYCIYDPVTNIDALRYATNLTNLNLAPENNADGTYTDLSALSGLSKLTTLDLSNDESLTDVTPLASLTNLQSLSLAYDTGVDPSDLIALLPNLVRLSIDKTQLSVPAYLASLHKLTYLSMVGVPVSSSTMTILEHLHLTSLYVGDGDVADLQDIGSMQGLTALEIIRDPDATDASFLTGMKNLGLLILYADGFTNLSVMSTLPDAGNVVLGGQSVELPKDATVGVPYELPVIRDPSGNVVAPVPGNCGGVITGNSVTFTTCVGYVRWSDSGTLRSGYPWYYDGEFSMPNTDFSQP